MSGREFPECGSRLLQFITKLPESSKFHGVYMFRKFALGRIE